MRLQLALLTVLGGLAAAGPAQAFTSSNLIVNGDAEAGPGATDSSTTQTPPGWQEFGGFTAVNYGVSGFLTTAQSESWGGGKNFFAGGTGAQGDNTVAFQQIDLTPLAAQIDGGKLNVTLSGLIGGFGGQDDQATVTAALVAPDGSTGAAVGIGPVTDADRGGQTVLLQKNSCMALPAGVRDGTVAISIQRTAGAYNDGYLDNLSLILSDDACSTAEPLPPQAPPVVAQSGNASVVSGKVKVRVPGSKQFVELDDPSKVPVGSEFDATKGVVAIQTAANTTGATQTGQFSQGKFTMTQTKGKAPVTEMRLSDPLSCTAGKGNRVSSAAKTRKLFGDSNKGRFRTRGRHATATVRGTRWVTKDACKSTTVTVSRGTVIVRDLVKRKNFTVKKGHSYTARAKK